MIYEGHQKITGLAFKLVSKNQVLFVATEGEILCITLLPKDKEHKVSSCSLNLVCLGGVAVGCWTCNQ